MFVVLISVLVAYMILGFVASILFKDNSIADVMYGKAVMLMALVSHVLGGAQGVGCVLTILAIIWGVRLACRIYFKNHGKPEDRRYAQWREEWSKRSMGYFYMRSFFQVFVLQGVIIFLVSLPVVLANFYGVIGYEWCAYAGIAVWIVGFLFEAVADFQLDRFVKNPDNKGNICTVGLWKYSRHPNYFGEALMWWGMAFSAGAVMPTEVLAGLVFISPALVTFLLLYVSGIPMLEAYMKSKPGWDEYARKTNAFIPWFPRRDV